MVYKQNILFIGKVTELNLINLELINKSIKNNFN